MGNSQYSSTEGIATKGALVEIQVLAHKYQNKRKDVIICFINSD